MPHHDELGTLALATHLVLTHELESTTSSRAEVHAYLLQRDHPRELRESHPGHQRAQDGGLQAQWRRGRHLPHSLRRPGQNLQSRGQGSGRFHFSNSADKRGKLRCAQS